MDYYEYFFTFIVSLFIVLTFLTVLWHVNYKEAIKSSRCYKPNNSTNNKISLVAKDTYDNSMYRVKYDLKKRTAQIKCACKEGDIKNNFKVNYFDMNKYTTKSRDLVCSCSEEFNFIDELNTYYYGTPGLVNYMENEDTAVFAPAYEE
jgi:hypothetical protein